MSLASPSTLSTPVWAPETETSSGSEGQSQSAAAASTESKAEATTETKVAGDLVEQVAGEAEAGEAAAGEEKPAEEAPSEADYGGVKEILATDATNDPERVERALSLAAPKFKELGLSKEQAEGVAKLHADIVKAEIAREVEALGAEADATIGKREARLKELLEKPVEKGGFGYAAWDPSSTDHPAKVDAVRGLMAIAPGTNAEEKVALVKEVLDALDQTGATTTILPFLARIGRGVKEDGLKLGTGALRPRTPAETMYPNMARKGA